MITQQNLRAILPGKIARTVMIIAARDHRPSLEVLKSFYRSPVYQKLEVEETKYWWQSPEQLAMTDAL